MSNASPRRPLSSLTTHQASPIPSMVTRVLLVRHGQSEGNAERRFGGHSPTPLSERGVREAAAAARALEPEQITAIYSSDLWRARQTAEPLARATGLDVIPLAAFRERHVGRMEGLTFEEAALQFPDEYAALLRRDYERVLLDGESYRQLLDRAAHELDRAINNHRGGAIAVFSHTGTICILALHLMGALDAPDPRPVWIASSNAGISRFDVHADGFVRVLAINDTHHLTDI